MSSAGFVLVGGQSKRMGRDKALLPWKSRSLVEAVAAKALQAVATVALVGNSDRYSHLGFSTLKDQRPGLGPLAGIEAALLSNRGEYSLILACDMPQLNGSHLRALLRHAREKKAACLVTVDCWERSHPLCAVYHSACLPIVSQALDERRLKLQDVTRELRADSFRVTQPVLNVNTPEEWIELMAETS